MADLHAVYRMFDAEGRLLYVGMTGNAGTRLGSHASKRWFPLVTNITLQWCPTKAAARVSEVRAIRNEWPRYNVADRFGRMPEDVPAPVRAAEIVAAIPDISPLPQGPVGLAEAVRLGILHPDTTVGALRMARFRKQLPEPVGVRGAEYLYDQAALIDYDAGRRR
jgi:hypothetical protein